MFEVWVERGAVFHAASKRRREVEFTAELRTLTGVAVTSVLLRRAQFCGADDSGKCAAIARQIIAGKLRSKRRGA